MFESESETLLLVCFPHAGGGTGRYRTWRAHLPDNVKLILPCLPGREGRIIDEPLDNIAAVTDDVLCKLTPETSNGNRLAIVGLSYGALIAYDVAARLEASGQPVEALFVASQRAPATPAPSAGWHRMADEALLAKLTAIGGLSIESGEDEEFLDLFLPVIRTDLQASETYVKPAAYAPLRCPVYLYHGNADTAVSTAAAHAWRNETAQFSLRNLNAGHFLIAEDGTDLWFETMRADLEKHASISMELSC